MSGLRSAIDEIAARELSCLTGDELTAELSELSRAVDVITCRLASIADEARRRGIPELQGFLSVTRWLAHTTDCDDSTAQRQVTLGRTLHDHPETRRRAETGDLSGARLRILARAARAHPEPYRNHEALLLGFANDLDLRDLRKAVTHWSNCADAVAAERTFNEQQEASYLFVSLTGDDMVKIDGLLDKETGEAVLTALDTAMTPLARAEGAGDDLRPAPRRRAEALGEICTRFLDNHPGIIGGHRPHVSVIVDLDTLIGRDGKRCELAHTGTITPETARRILCDADVTRILVDGDSVPLDMGRAVRTATPAQRRALAVRDGGCTTAGCGRPPDWCDVHHRTHWINGGKTDLDDLELLCKRHHMAEHRGDPRPGTAHDHTIIRR
ncbi:MAG: DUF222 domain-containing protein [Acidimicrobiia bacterium]|nr:DUF222 domain-containing protein [Acidimicrobiia bacterium]